MKYLLMDLDDTIIQTKSGKKFAEGPEDWQFKSGIITALQDYNPTSIHIVSNQGGIPEYVSEEDFKKKLDKVCRTLRMALGIKVTAAYCTSLMDQKFRKPNTGMYDSFVRNRRISEQDILMVGDASGKPGDFSDSDKMFAENAGIPYQDVNDFISCYSTK